MRIFLVLLFLGAFCYVGYKVLYVCPQHCIEKYDGVNIQCFTGFIVCEKPDGTLVKDKVDNW